jgi:hypothetical protein
MQNIRSSKRETERARERVREREGETERACAKESERERAREREIERAQKKKPVDNHDDSVIINAPVILNCQAGGLRNIIVNFILYNINIIIGILN